MRWEVEQALLGKLSSREWAGGILRNERRLEPDVFLPQVGKGLLSVVSC